MKRLALGLMLLCLPLLEIALLIRTGQRIGLWPTMAIIIGTGVLGVVVLVRQRFAVVSGVMKAVNEGKTPLAPVLDGAFLVLAGGLLFSPGLICDAAGLLLLLPPVRRLVAQRSVERLLRDAEIRVAVLGEGRLSPSQGSGAPGTGKGGTGAGGTVIEGEFQRLGERRPDPDGSDGRKR